MHVCYVSGYFDPSVETGAEVVARVDTLREFAHEQARLGHLVDVVHLFHADEYFERDRVRYHFVRPAHGLAQLGQLAAVVLRDWPHPYYQLATRMLTVIRDLRPDVLHFFGLTIDLNLWLVSRTCRQLGIPLVVQFHGGGPPRNRWRRRIQQHNLSRAGRLLFTTREHATPWVQEGIIDHPAKVVPFMETSSTFCMQPRDDARRQTQMIGDPVFLSTGRLHAVKNPITIINGFSQILNTWPDAQLYMYYLTDELLPALRHFLEQQPDLAEHVHFRGRAPFEQMEAIYNSADFLLQASTNEISGCAVLEAMACGVIPVVSDIPSFRSMTDDGQAGILFPPGDADHMARALLAISREEIPQQSRVVRRRFEQALSFPVLAQQLSAIYQELTEAPQPQFLTPKASNR